MLFNLFKPKKPAVRRPGTKSANKRRAKHAQDKNNRVEKIPVDRLRLGMYVRELDIPWEQSTFLFQGVDIKTQQDILDVQKQCAFVWVDYTEYRLIEPEKKASVKSPFASNTSTILVEEEYEDAKEVHVQAKQLVANIFDDIRVGGEVDVDKVKLSVSGSVDSILRNPDASIWLTRLHEKDNISAQHSMNITALSIITGRSLGMSKTELENLGVCALMHDIGKTRLPLALLNKEGPLTEAETVLMQTHPTQGQEILLSSKNIYAGTAEVAHCHHEHVDGSGYPRGLTGDKIPQFAKIVAIADAYDCMTTRQINNEVKSPTATLDALYAKRGTQFDEELVIKFIDGIGIFPPGSIVEMTNGEVAIVLSTTQEKLRPRVIIILDEVKDAAVQQMVDLSLMSVDSAGQPYQIKSTLCDGTFGIFVDEFQRAGLRIG